MGIRRLIRTSLRLLVASALAAGTLALVRRTLGRLTGEPRVAPAPVGNGTATGNGTGTGNGRASVSARRISMSFDSWPAVPEAPHRGSPSARRRT